MNLLKLKFPFEIRKISLIFKSTRLKQNSFNKPTLPSKPLNRPIKQYWHYTCTQIDEGTDCSNLSTLMVYVRYLVDGIVHSKFASVRELPGASADAIVGVLMNFF